MNTLQRALLAATLGLLSPFASTSQTSADLLATGGAGDLTATPTSYGWRSTWHHIVAGRFDANLSDDLLLYDRVSGHGRFVTRQGANGFATIQSHGGWSTSWDQIVPGEFGGSASFTDLLFYDARGGTAKFYTTDGAGNITLLRAHSGWQEWDTIVPGNFNGDGHTDLFFYSRTRGEGKFFTTDGAGNIALLSHYTALNKNWDQIVAGNFDGNGITDLFFYQRVLGLGRIYTTDGAGQIQLLSQFNGLRKSWDLVVPGAFGGGVNTDLFFYDRTAGEARYSFADGAGGLVNQPIRSVSKRWFSIVNAGSGGRGFADMLAYDNSIRIRVHAVKCEDSDGGRATAITTGQVQQWVDRANVVYARAGIRIEFDPSTDFETLRDTSINSLDVCSAIPSSTVCASLKAAASAWATRYPCKVVVFFRHGYNPSATGTGFSSEVANYIAMPGFANTGTWQWFQDASNPAHGTWTQNIKLFAHELGHYLGLDHTFVSVNYGGFSTPLAAVVNYLSNQPSAAMTELDGDDQETFDTPPDVGIDYFHGNGWNPADLAQEIRIVSSSLGIDYTFSPDRHNVMSYFNICDDYFRVSPDQVRKVRELLHGAKSQLIDACADHVPGSWFAYGPACPGTGGQLPQLTVNGLIETGGTVSFDLGRARPSTPGVVIFGANSFQVPLDAAGMPGCVLGVQSFASAPMMTTPLGTHSLRLNIPVDSTLFLATLYAQSLLVDPGAPTVTGIVTTNSVAWRIGGDR